MSYAGIHGTKAFHATMRLGLGPKDFHRARAVSFVGPTLEIPTCQFVIVTKLREDDCYYCTARRQDHRTTFYLVRWV